MIFYFKFMINCYSWVIENQEKIRYNCGDYKEFGLGSVGILKGIIKFGKEEQWNKEVQDEVNYKKMIMMSGFEED